MVKRILNSARYKGSLDRNGNAIMGSLEGGDSSMSSYGVTARDNWVARANKRPLVVTRTQAT